MTQSGHLTIRFSKRILKSVFLRKGTRPTPTTPGRILASGDQAAEAEYREDISELITVEVKDAAVDDDVFDKRIRNVTISDVQDFYIRMKVEFWVAADISTDAVEPDELKISFEVTELFIDAETLEPLNLDEKFIHYVTL